MKRLKRLVITGVAALVAAQMIGCRGAGGRVDETPPPAGALVPADWPVDIREQPMFDGSSGLAMKWSGVLASAANADAVIIGEMHGHERGLGVASALFEDLLSRRPNTATLSMEFFERDEQAALDDYLTGVTDEDAFMEAAGRTDGNYPEGHRAMVEAAKAAGRPVIAANAPRRYVRLARTDGFDRLASLTPIQRALFVIPESLTTGGYRDRFYGLMGGMAGGGGGHSEDGSEPADVEAMVTPFYRSQNVWDATMADSILRALEVGGGPVVHVVGQFHCDFEGGLVTRLRDLRPGVKILVVSMSGEWSRELTQDDIAKGDIVVYVGE